jgi:hypothetical protein
MIFYERQGKTKIIKPQPLSRAVNQAWRPQRVDENATHIPQYENEYRNLKNSQSAVRIFTTHSRY